MKKKSLSAVIVLFLALCLTSNSAIAKTLKFAAISDVHYSQYGNKEAQKALNGLVTRINENNYKFAIFLGDNIEKSKQENLEGFLNILNKVKTPYYLVLGNRDAHKISGIEKKDYLATVSKYNRHQPKDSASYYFYPNSDIVAIVLDNVSSGLPSTHGVFTPKTLLWLDNVLTKNKNKKAIIFQHVPYIVPYTKDSHEMLSPNDFRAILVRHENVIAVVSGHYHKNYKITDNQKVRHISAPALFEHPYEYLEINIKYDKPFLQNAQNIDIEIVPKPAI